MQPRWGGTPHHNLFICFNGFFACLDWISHLTLSIVGPCNILSFCSEELGDDDDDDEKKCNLQSNECAIIMIAEMCATAIVVQTIIDARVDGRTAETATRPTYNHTTRDPRATPTTMYTTLPHYPRR